MLLENFLREPLSYYSSETDDLFIIAVGNYYNFNVVIYHADTTKRWVTNFHKGLSDKNLYFARSISEHIDQIVPQKKRSLPSTSLLYKSVAAKTRKRNRTICCLMLRHWMKNMFLFLMNIFQPF